MSSRKIMALLAGVVSAALALPALADASFPDRPLTAYVGFRAGGGTDTLGRVVARVMGETLGQQVNVINKTGAGGGIAAATVQRAKPDGYSFLLSSTSSITNAPLLNSSLTYGVEDFAYAGIIAAYQAGIAAPIGKPFDTLPEFIAFARENPGAKYVFLTPMSRMIMQYIVEKEQIDVNFVPAKGGSAVLNLFASKQVDAGYTGGFHQRHPDKMKLLVAATSKRQPANPDVPTLSELGIPIAANAQIIVAFPKGVPDVAISKIEAALKVAVAHPDVQKAANKLRYPIDYHSAMAATQEMREQTAAYKEIIAGAKATN